MSLVYLLLSVCVCLFVYMCVFVSVCVHRLEVIIRYLPQMLSSLLFILKDLCFFLFYAYE